MRKIDEALNEFEAYRLNYQSYIKEDFSESDTRSKLIDKLFIDVLGWDEADIKREGHNSKGYYDYKVSIPGFMFLIEAKKLFAEFSLPSNHKCTTLKVLNSGNHEIVEQIRKYASEEGVQYGVLTNGTQVILTKVLNTDGKDWKENIALIFRNLEDIKIRFIEFYENLSKHSVMYPTDQVIFF